MAHRSGGGSHSGGHHSGGHHSSSHGGSGGGNAARYSNKPFPNARRFRYYDRRGRERYLYGSQMPTKTSLFSLIFSLIFFIPFILGSIYSVICVFLVFMPTKPLKPDYEPTDVHTMDRACVMIDNSDSLEEILREFEDETGISPYVITVFDEDWEYYDELWEYAYEIYNNLFSDEQHFLIVYSEPEITTDLDFVDWSWEGIQGDDTDKILTEANMERFTEDLHDNLLRDSYSVGEAFEKTFKNSLTYVMKKNNNGDAVATILFVIVWNTFIIFAISTVIKSYIIGKREYQEVPIEGFTNTVPGTMGGNNTAYQNGTTFQNGTAYQSGTGVPYQNNNASQYNAADANYYNDEARFRSPEYYDDDARYRGSTAYEDGKK
ncbi:MAG: NUDIX hydrolase [Lachnospiraceae bacterium]|nr:NUDIX hydrolase [Lachnospiraceae bacterium]